MSIRIGLLKNGYLETVYVTYPKEINNICKILKENYDKINKIKNLLSYGDIYNLKNTVEETSFFSRDKGDPIDVCASYKEEADNLQTIDTDRSPIDYYFIWTNKWNVCKAYTHDWISLTKFLKKK